MASSSPPAPALARRCSPSSARPRRARRPSRASCATGSARTSSRPTRRRSTATCRSSPRRPTTRRSSSGPCRSTEDVSVGEYQRWAHAAIDASRRGRCSSAEPACISRAAVSALELPPPAEPGRRAYWQAEYDRLGSAAAHEALTRVDPAAAARVHANDRKRVVRALELAETGASLAPEHDRLWTEELRVETLIVALDLPLDVLDDRIEARTLAMAGRRRRGRGCAARGRASSRRPRARCSGSSSSRPCPSTRPSRRSRSRHAARPLPAQVATTDAGRRYAPCESVCGGGRR